MDRYFICPRGHRRVVGKTLRLPFVGRSGRCTECESSGYWISIPSAYKVEGDLGSGGMGIVLRASNRETGEPVALKLLKPAFYGDPDQLDRFFLEARAMQLIAHPNIVAIHEVGEEEGVPFIAAELVEGGSLSRQMGGRAWGAVEAAQLVRNLAEAIHSAHARGIIHRDLKPANILMSPVDGPKITDFGLAKFIQEDQGLTCTGLIMGTPSYMSPEQARGENEKFGPGTDIYALGVILYQLLTGGVPFTGRSSVEVLHNVIHSRPELPSLRRMEVPAILDEICSRCLEKEPSERYATAMGLAHALQEFMDRAETDMELALKPRSGDSVIRVREEDLEDEDGPTIKAPAAGAVRDAKPGVGFLQGLTLEQMDAMMGSGSYLEFARGQAVFKEGDPARSLYMVLKGRVEVVRSEGDQVHTLAELGPNDIFGELGILLDDATRTATARATARTTLFEIPGNTFNLIRMFADARTTSGIMRNLITILRGHLLVRDRIGLEAGRPAPRPEDHAAQVKRLGEILQKMPKSLSEIIDEQQMELRDDYLFRQGDAPDGFYFIHGGEIEVVQREEDGSERVIVKLGAPNLVGEVGYFSRSPRSASVRAKGRLSYTHISDAVLSRLAAEAPQDALALYFAAAKYIAYLLVRRDANLS